jgi:hypothetical protein
MVHYVETVKGVGEVYWCATHQPFNGGDGGGIGEALLFILFYLMLVYIPWYFFTGDRIYDV